MTTQSTLATNNRADGETNFFLLDPHPVMPNMTLSRDDARDLAAYIATQR